MCDGARLPAKRQALENKLKKLPEDNVGTTYAGLEPYIQEIVRSEVNRYLDTQNPRQEIQHISSSEGYYDTCCR